jgi:hypothetical protein
MTGAREGTHLGHSLLRLIVMHRGPHHPTSVGLASGVDPSPAGRQRPLPRRLVLRLGEPDSAPVAIRIFNDMRHDAKTS